MEINSVELKERINNGEKIIIDFWAPWCGPCKVMKPIFERVAKSVNDSNEGVKLYTMNADENKQMLVDLNIRSIPTIKSFSNGKEVSSHSGVMMDGGLNELVNKLKNG